MSKDGASRAGSGKSPGPVEQSGDRIINAIKLFEQTIAQHATTLKELKATTADLARRLAALDRALATHTHDTRGRAGQPFITPGG